MTVTLIVPGLFVCALAFLYVALPAGNSQRLPFLNMVLLSVIVFLMIMSELIPVQA